MFDLFEQIKEAIKKLLATGKFKLENGKVVPK